MTGRCDGPRSPGNRGSTKGCSARRRSKPTCKPAGCRPTSACRPRPGSTRTWGDCYGYLLVATGRCEAMVDPKMNLWDNAALQPIIEEAGGTFTDWQGTPTIHSPEAVATNGRVLDEVLAVTRKWPARKKVNSGSASSVGRGSAGQADRRLLPFRFEQFGHDSVELLKAVLTIDRVEANVVMHDLAFGIDDHDQRQRRSENPRVVELLQNLAVVQQDRIGQIHEGLELADAGQGRLARPLLLQSAVYGHAIDLQPVRSAAIVQELQVADLAVRLFQRIVAIVPEVEHRHLAAEIGVGEFFRAQAFEREFLDRSGRRVCCSAWPGRRRGPVAIRVPAPPCEQA